MKKITKEYIESRIKEVKYYHLPDSTHTACYIIIDNGFIVTGESACISADFYDPELGRNISYDKAFNKLWELFGFVAKEMTYTTNK